MAKIMGYVENNKSDDDDDKIIWNRNLLESFIH